MQKQLKKLRRKGSSKKFRFKKEKNFKFKKSWSYLSRGLRYKTYRLNPLFCHKKRKKILSIRLTVKPNNIFCVLQKFKTNKTLFKLNSGEAKIKITSKRLKSSFKFVLGKFFFRVNRFASAKTRFCVQVVCPLRMKKGILRFLSDTRQGLSNSLIAVNLISKKAYNGSRPAKMRRKKRRGIKILK